MNWTKLQHAIEAASVRCALALLRMLGPVTASNLGGVVARTIGPLLPVSRVADTNLRLALPDLNAAERRRIICGVWDNLGRTAAELPHVGRLGPTESGPGWEVEGADIVLDLARRGGPAIFVSGHIGNWELLPAALATAGLRISSFYRAAANPVVDRIIVELRQTVIGEGTPQFPKGAVGARGAMAHLRAGGFLGVLNDQKMNDGIEATLFGHKAMTAPAAAVFARMFNCPVVAGYVQRLGPARFRLICEPQLVVPVTDNRSEDVAALTQTLNDHLERWITERPAEWLWLHRRWPKEVYARPPKGPALS